MDPDELILQERGRDLGEEQTVLLTPTRTPEWTPFSGSGHDTALRVQDADHQRRFKRFLHFCGIEEKTVAPPLPSLRRVRTRDRSGSPRAESRAESRAGSTNSANTGTSTDYDNDSEHGGSVRTDPLLQGDDDVFYRTYSDVFAQEEGPEYGDETDEDSVAGDAEGGAAFRDDYASSIYIVGGRYSDVVCGKHRKTQMHELLEEGVPTNSNDTFANYEGRLEDKDFNINMVPSTEFSETMDSIVKTQPAAKFKDSLSLQFVELQRMKFGIGRKYKNNITACSQEHDLVFVAANSSVAVFAPRLGNGTGSWDPLLEFETRPSETTDIQRANSTWPYYPHTINYILVAPFKGREVLAITCDDGRVLFYYTATLVEELSRQSNSRQVLTLDPDFSLEVDSSAWGLDIDGEKIIVSDNSQRITLFYCVGENENFVFVKTHQLMHNIPNVTFIRDCSTNGIFVSTACISGELLVFEFPLRRDSAGSIYFHKPRVLSRALLEKSAWCTQHIDGKYFKKVASLQLMTGDPWADQDGITTDKVLNESSILDVESDVCTSSHLGLAAEFQNLFIPTLSTNHPYYSRSFKALTTDTDRLRRIRKVYDDYYAAQQRGRTKVKSKNGKSYWEPVVSSHSFANKFLLVSTKEQVGLFRVNHLLYNATVSDLFEYRSPNEEILYSNRLSLSLLIPELSCYIVASQVGLVSIFRLTEYRGIYGMRQEYVVPNYRKVSTSGNYRVRTLIGITAKKMDSCYRLYLVYVDGLFLTYTLGLPKGGGSSSETDLSWI